MPSIHSPAVRELLGELLQRQLPPDAYTWLTNRRARYRAEPQGRHFQLTFGLIPRRLGKEPIRLTEAERALAADLRSGFQPSGWPADRMARVWWILQATEQEEEAFVGQIEQILSTADLGELVAIYSSLPLLPYPERFVALTAEGIRTNMTSVFDAIALDNPYPADYLPAPAWNQMYLKAAFMDRPLHRIVGIDRRANAELARIISDYAHERWAAGRIVSPELWRPVGAYLDATLLADLQRLLQADDPRQRQAAALVLQAAGTEAAQALLAAHPDLQADLAAGRISWAGMAKSWWRDKQ